MATEKNHYIPKFYTSAWTLPTDGKLCQYWRPPGRSVVVKRHAPDGVGFKYGLYTVQGLAPEAAHWIEDAFLLYADNQASVAHKLMLADRLDDVQGPLKTAWSRFILTLLHRNPEKIDHLKKQWADQLPTLHANIEKNYSTVPAGDPPMTLEEYKANHMHQDDAKGFVLLVQAVMDSERVGNRLNSMKWSVITIKVSPERLLTSDRPVTQWGAFTSGYLTLPLSPDKLFLATNDDSAPGYLMSLGGRYLAALSNNRVVRQAAQYVYGQDDSLLRIVERGLGKYPDQQRFATIHK